MARSGCSLTQAADELKHPATSVEVENILRRKSFIRVLWEARHRYFAQLGTSSELRKETAIGKLIDLAEKLEMAEEYDKAAECWFKAAKMQGWVGPESTVSVFGELSQADLDQIKKKIEEGAVAVRPN